jgi:hypothetical protein
MAVSATVSKPCHAAPEHILSGEQIDAYERAGWVAVSGFFSRAEAAQISGWTQDLEQRPEQVGAHMVYHELSLTDARARLVQRIENFCPVHPDYDRMIRGPLRAAVEQLLGEPAALFKDKINFKMAGGAGFEPHQDQQAGWSRYASLFVTALVCIDRATLDNGCLEMAVAPRFAGMIGDEWAPLTPEQMSGFTLIPVPAEPGDVLFFDSYAPHASKPNLTVSARRILYATYNAQSFGDHRARYFAEKRANFPPDIERAPGTEYRFRV